MTIKPSRPTASERSHRRPARCHAEGFDDVIVIGRIRNEITIM